MSGVRRRLVAIDDPLAPGSTAPEGAPTQPRAPSRAPRTETAALYVRLRPAESERLARAAFELGAHKREIIGALIARYVDGETQAGCQALRELLDDFRRLAT